MNVVQVLKTSRSKNHYVRYLLAIIMRCEVEKGFILLGFYITTHHNKPADDISREFGPLLAELGYDGTVLAMQEILNKNPKWRHLRHEPMTDVLRFCRIPSMPYTRSPCRTRQKIPTRWPTS